MLRNHCKTKCRKNKNTCLGGRKFMQHRLMFPLVYLSMSHLSCEMNWQSTSFLENLENCDPALWAKKKPIGETLLKENEFWSCSRSGGGNCPKFSIGKHTLAVLVYLKKIAIKIELLWGYQKGLLCRLTSALWHSEVDEMVRFLLAKICLKLTVFKDRFFQQ